MSLPRYPQYKDSGIEWLGEVPVHWEIRRLSSLAKILSGYPFEASLFGFEGTPVIRMSDFADGNVLREDAKRVESAPVEAMAIADDILLGLSGSISNFAIVKPQDLPIAVNQRVAIIRKLSEKLGMLPWLLQSKVFAQQITVNLPATTILNISMGQLRQCRFSLPTSKEEQTAIAAFLDRETGKIDALIAEQEKLLTMLAEKRQATISHAVTKGLNPDAPMKDSGVEWLGEMPGHWGVVPLRWYANCRSGDGISTEEVVLESDELHSIPTIGGNGRMGFSQSSNVSRPVLAIGRVGALCGNVHQVSPPAWITDNALVLEPTDAFHLSYLEHVLRSRNLNEIASKTAQPLVTGTQVRDQRVPCPPSAEQIAIALFIDADTTRLDALTVEATRGIALLKERRSALIAAAVTGQIDVRGLVTEPEAA